MAQNLLTMSYKQEVTIRMFLSVALEVECRYYSFTCSCGSHDQISKMFMNIAFYVKFLQNLLLVVLCTHKVKGRKVE